MSLAVIVVLAGAWLLLAYFTYGSWLSRRFQLDPKAQTPAVALRDDLDYAPIDKKFLLGQHFSAIAAAGPIVGPILAGVMFGWVPALLWLLLGSVFIGGVHDLGALIASVRHQARSIAEVVREHMTRRSYLLFLAFVWLTLVYIIVAFTDIVGSSFVGIQTLENGVTVSGGGIAASSLLYLALPIFMGLLLRYTRLSLRSATLIFLPLVGVAIWIGQDIPLDLARLFRLSDLQAQKLWDVLLLIYCAVASLAPMWILLQPRGHLGGWFLIAALAGGMLGVLFGGQTIRYPAFTGFFTDQGEPLFPLLFILIACGACSGFHAVVASGTTCKQLRTEPDAKLIGYGGMLMEGMVGVVSLACVMMLAKDSPVLQGGAVKANFIYGLGMSRFLEVAGIPPAFGVSFGLLAFTTFVYDTLDVCTRLGRYVVQELTGWRGQGGRLFATALTTAAPLYLVMQTATDAAGHPVPAWKLFWPLFGASNQLLAALTLIGLTVWLSRARQGRWIWWVLGAPALWMYSMSVWALLRFIQAGLLTPAGEWKGISWDPVTWVAVILVALAALLLVEAFRIFFRTRRRPAPKALGKPAG